jgi:hypothetical protein
MAIFSANVAPDSTTTANFRLWGSFVDNTFVASGWVQTSDTGQINWGTATVPNNVNTIIGYSIFRMNDTLQATKPVFVKMEYGQGSTMTFPYIGITIGTGSDGAGNITGILRARGLFTANQTSALLTIPSYISGSNNRWCATLWPNSSNHYSWFTFSIERTKDSAGAVTNDGLMYFAGSIISSSISQYLPFTGTIPSTYTAWNCCVPASATNSAFKNTVALYPIKCWTPGESGPSTNIFMYNNLDITPSVGTSNTISVSLFDGGVTSTYIPITFFGAFSTVATYNRGSVPNTWLAMRWE